tara:strand:+ start:1063 stop:1542 length:480 start_codon:yes stop_codon:yes gene_type:complete
VINRTDLEQYIIEPALREISMFSKNAVHLLSMTAALESDLGFHLKQVNGPALGIYQMEPDTHDDVWDSVLAFNANKLNRVMGSGCAFSEAKRMIYDLKYATIMARVLYSRFKEVIPDLYETKDMINYYLEYWKPNKRVMNYEKAKLKYKYYFGTGVKND